MIVDSSVWIDFFSGAASWQAERLSQAIGDSEEVVIIPEILTEVLQGCRSDRQFEQIKKLFYLIPILRPSVETYVDAAVIYRKLRKKGITVRGARDFIVSATAIEHDLPLLTRDTDFQKIARHTSLQLVTG